MRTPSLLISVAFALALTAPSAVPQSALNRAVRTAENLEPAIPHPDQDQAVAAKLAALEKKTGKKPNVLWLLADDMGFGDPGCYGGGKAIGAHTPHSEVRARQGTRRVHGNRVELACCPQGRVCW